MSKIFTKLALLLAVVCVTSINAEAGSPNFKMPKMSSNSVGRSSSFSSNAVRSNVGNLSNSFSNKLSQSNVLSKPIVNKPLVNQSLTSNVLNNVSNFNKLSNTGIRPNLGGSNILVKPGNLSSGHLGNVKLPDFKLPQNKLPNVGNLVDLKSHKFPGITLPVGGVKHDHHTPSFPSCGPIKVDHHHHNGGWCGTGNLKCHLPWITCGHYCPPTTVVVPQPVVVPVQVAPAMADVVIDKILLLETGDPNQNLGPLVRVFVANHGNAAAGRFSLGLYASLQSQPNPEMIPAGLDLPGLAAGQHEAVDVRLPVQALAMMEAGQPMPQTFRMLFVVADVQNEVVEAEKRNNLVPISSADLLSTLGR